MKFIKRILIGVILVGISIALYSRYIEPKLLIAKKYNVKIKKENFQNLKIVQFTDTHLGEFYTLEDLQRVVDKINSQKPDIVLFTGDLIDNASIYKDIYKIPEVLNKIDAKIGKYAIYGNHDYGGGAVRYYEDIMNKSGFKVLINQKESFEFDGKKINIFGADDVMMGKVNINETMKNINSNDVNILMVHEPDISDKFKEYPIDLIFSGHSHGGQIYIPFYGAIKKNLYAEKYNKGFYELSNERKTKIYVNSGIGNTKLPFRLGNIPQISVVELKN